MASFTRSRVFWASSRAFRLPPSRTPSTSPFLLAYSPRLCRIGSRNWFRARESRLFTSTSPTRIHATDPGHVEGNPVIGKVDGIAQGLGHLGLAIGAGKEGDIPHQGLRDREDGLDRKSTQLNSSHCAI